MAYPLDLTFHLAFENVVQPRKSLKKIMDLGFNRVLTSEQQLMAIKGLALLVELQNIAKDGRTGDNGRRGDQCPKL